jgi:hypothetical protein
LSSPSNPDSVLRERPREDVEHPREASDVRRSWRGLRPGLFGGGIDGNEQLTAMTGLVLIVLLAVLGITVVRIGQLMWLHLFLGLLLLGPVLLKMASTGYRFGRYYTRAALYRAKGPPMLALRAMGPIVVLTTLIVFISGVVLLFNGPRGRGTLVLIHKASFIVWLVFTAIHVLAHLPNLGRSLRAVSIEAEASGVRYDPARSGAPGRSVALAGAIIAGAVLAVVLIPHFGVWTAPGALPHHHEH